MKKITLLLISQLFFTTTIFSQDGTLDPDFGEGGILTSTLNADFANFPAIELQSTGKIIGVGAYSPDISSNYGIIARYGQNGDLDLQFGNNGFISHDIDGLILTSVVVYPNDSFLVGGFDYQDAYLFKYNSDGTPDNNFGNNGFIIIQNTSLTKVLINDNSIFVAGMINNIATNSDFAVSKFDIDGNPVQTFGTDGISIIAVTNSADNIRSAAIDNDNNIVLAGATSQNGNPTYALVKLNPDGSLNSNFGQDGIVIGNSNADFAEVYSVQNLPDNSLICAGMIDGDIAVFKYGNTGVLIAEFGTGGISMVEFGNLFSKSFNMELQEDGKIVVVGFCVDQNQTTPSNSCIARLETDGDLDNTFGSAGKIITSTSTENDRFVSLVIQPDNAIIASGDSGNGIALVRYLAGESLSVLNFSVKTTTSYVYPNPVTSSSVLEYTLPSDEHVTIELFDLSGKKVKTLLSNTKQPAGNYRQQLLLPSELLSGTYLVVLSTPNAKATVKIIK